MPEHLIWNGLHVAGMYKLERAISYFGELRYTSLRCSRSLPVLNRYWYQELSIRPIKILAHTQQYCSISCQVRYAHVLNGT